MGRLHRLAAAFWGSPRQAAFTSIALVAILATAVALFPAVSQFVVGLVVASPVALLIAAFPNEAKQLAGRALGHVATLHDRIELESVRQDLEGTLSIGAARFCALAPAGTVPPGLRLDYVRSPDDIAALPDGTLVIGVDKHNNRDRNLVAAAWAYARHGVLREARPYLDHEVSSGIDLVVAKEILEHAGASAVREFLRVVWGPAVLGQERLRELTAKLEVIQQNRLFGPIVMSEFHELAASMGFRFPVDVISAETAEFVDFVYEIACREPGMKLGDHSNFEGQAIRCRILYVARPEVYAVKGPGPHRGAIDWSIRRLYHRVYLLASGGNVGYVREVLEPYTQDKRIRGIVEVASSRTLRTGRLMKQYVFQVSVDVRYRVGIGNRPQIAVGPGAADQQSRKIHRVG